MDRQSSQPIRVGVIGLGFGGSVHVPAFRLDDRCVVGAICGRNAERTRRTAEELEIPLWFDSPEKMIADAKLDLVSIAVPPARQPRLIEAAARAGKHIFCEKPLGFDFCECRRAAQTVVASGVRNAIDFIFPEIPAWRQAKEVLERGELGELRHAAVDWQVETYAYQSKSDSWKTASEEGGGTLGNFVSHSLYYLEWLLGGVAALSARLSPAPIMGGRAESRVDAWLTMESGLPVTLSVAADSFLGGGHRVEIYGDQGTLLLHNPTADYVNGFELWVGRRQDGKLIRRVGGASGNADGRISAVNGIVRRLIDSIPDQSPVIPGIDQALRVQVLSEAMRAANTSRRWQIVRAEQVDAIRD